MVLVFVRAFSRKRVCIRLLDGPLQDFLATPYDDEGLVSLALRLNESVSREDCLSAYLFTLCCTTD